MTEQKPQTILPPEHRPVIYLAGKVGGKKWKLVEGLGNLAEFTASDGSNHSEHNFGVATYEYSEATLKDEVEECSIKQIYDCDLFIAFLDCPTSFGSIAEIAYASAYSKPCTLLIIDDAEEDENAFHPRAMFDAYWFVSCLPNVNTILVDSEDHARDALTSIVRDAATKRLYKLFAASLESPVEDTFVTALLRGMGAHSIGYDKELYIDATYQGINLRLVPQAHTNLKKNYRLDFLLQTQTLRLAIEIDGHDFHEKTKEQAQRDKERDRTLTAAGYTVLRFTGSEIYNNADKAVSEVLSLIKNKENG